MFDSAGMKRFFEEHPGAIDLVQEANASIQFIKLDDDDEKDNIRRELRKINRAGRSLIQTEDGLYLVDHTDKEGIDNRNVETQEGFQCLLKITTDELSDNEINNIKEEYDKRNGETPRGFENWLRSNGYSERLENSDSINAKVRKANADNVGLDKEASQRKSDGGFSDRDSQRNSGTGQVRTVFDGTNGPRYADFETFTTPSGEVYGFVDKEQKKSSKK